MTRCVWQHSRAAGNDLLVLLALADYCAKDDDVAWPSQDAIAEKTRLSESTVRRCLRSLEQLGELVTETNAGPLYRGARRSVNRYRIAIGGQSDRSKGGQSAPKGVQSDTERRSAVTARTGMNREGTGARATTLASAPAECPQHPGRPAKKCGLCRFDHLGPAA
jgi:hypothetical protein